jgi:ribosomal protein S18 acetylase RimI-like enzyme
VTVLENVNIRELKPEDADDICAIYEAIVQQPVSPDFRKLIRAHANRPEDACLVAEHNDRVVGFLVSYILTMGFGIDKSAWIATLGVDPRHMGQGIGAGMAREIFKYYQTVGIRRVYTSVRWDSPDLLSFFKTLGFDRSNFVNLKKNLK